MTSRSSPEYAYIELFGHTCLGACEVTEVERYGVKMCEARPLGPDGEPGAAQRFPGTAIYRERELTEEEAKRLAIPRMLSVVSRVPLPEQGGEAEETDFPPPIDDGTPLCEPIEEGEDDIPF